MLSAIGIGLIAAGILVVLFGDRSVGKLRGIVGKLFTWPSGLAKQIKIFIGLALVYAGVMLLIH